MIIGTNVTSAESYAHARDSAVDFVELLFDNFLHLDPAATAAELAGLPVGIHIMGSGWASDDAGLGPFVSATRAWADHLDIRYVSDHALLVRDDRGRRLPQMRELDYSDDSLFDRAAAYQEQLGVPLVLENFASESSTGRGQVDFFRRLNEVSGVAPLLDFSNAVVAELNGGDAAADWLEAGLPVRHAHVSGYRRSTTHPELVIDSHDTPVSPESLDLIRRMTTDHGGVETLVVERDGALDTSSWTTDLARVAATVHDATHAARERSCTTG